MMVAGEPRLARSAPTSATSRSKWRLCNKQAKREKLEDTTYQTSSCFFDNDSCLIDHRGGGGMGSRHQRSHQARFALGILLGSRRPFRENATPPIDLTGDAELLDFLGTKLPEGTFVKIRAK